MKRKAFIIYMYLWIPVFIMMLISPTDIVFCSPGNPATWDDFWDYGYPIQHEYEGDKISLLLNTLYLDELNKDDRDPKIGNWIKEEKKRTLENIKIAKLCLAGKAFKKTYSKYKSILDEASWKKGAVRFVSDYAEEQKYLARVFNSYPSEIRVYKSEDAGWELPDKTLVLSFDDGPSYPTTLEILKVLRSYKVPAVFFILGKSLRNARLSKTVPDYKGFLLGSHSFSHCNFAGKSQEIIRQEVIKTNREFLLAGLPEPVLIRIPYGSRTLKELSIIENLGKKSILWNMDSQDWQYFMQRERGRIANRVLALALLRRKGIILFHDRITEDAKILPDLLKNLNILGFKFTVPSVESKKATVK